MGPSSCSLCGLAAAGEMVDPGPAFGLVHRPCFIEMDVRDELEEHHQVDVLHFVAALPPRPARHVSKAARALSFEVAA